MGVAASVLLAGAATAAAAVLAFFIPRQQHLPTQGLGLWRRFQSSSGATRAAKDAVDDDEGVRGGEGEHRAADLESPTEPQQRSKRSIKRKKKEESILLMWAERKAQEKAERRAKREAALALQPDRQAPPAEEDLLRTAANRQRRSAKREQRREELREGCQRGATVVIDCEWLRDSQCVMADREVRSLSQQILYSYGVNKSAKVPVQMVLTGVDPGGALDMQLRKISGYPDVWTGVQITAAGFHEYFERLGNVVYLSSEADTVLEALEPEKVYVIGGIVDRNRMKGATKAKADKLGIATARLPIQENINTGQYSKVLAVNHVFEIVVEVQHSQDWRKTLERCMPGRKRNEAEAQTPS